MAVFKNEGGLILPWCREGAPDKISAGCHWRTKNNEKDDFKDCVGNIGMDRGQRMFQSQRWFKDPGRSWNSRDYRRSAHVGGSSGTVLSPRSWVPIHLKSAAIAGPGCCSPQ